jgi:hypothetical protein
LLNIQFITYLQRKKEKSKTMEEAIRGKMK